MAVLHVGGNQFIKPEGVIEIYTAWRSNTSVTSLLLVGSAPSDELATVHQSSAFRKIVILSTCLMLLSMKPTQVPVVCCFPSWIGFWLAVAEVAYRLSRDYNYYGAHD
jgi:hypothetical protein